MNHTQTTEEMGLLPNNLWAHGIVDADAVVTAVPAAASQPSTAPTPPPVSQPSSGPMTAISPDLGGAAPILRRYGSPTLRADLDQYQEVLLQFDGLSYNQFLALLR